MTDSLFGGATPGGSEFLDGSPGIMRAHTVKCAVTGTFTHICFYVGAQTGGTWTVRMWEVTANDVANGGAGDPLTSETLVGTPSANGWVNLALSSPVVVTDTSKLYRFGVSNGQYYWAENGFFADADLISGNLLSPQSGSSPTALGQINNGTFALLGSATGTNYPNLTGSAANYAVDVFFEPDEAPAEGTTALGLDLSPATSGATAHEGSAALGLNLAVASAGARDSSGAAALGLNFALDVTGAAPAVGAAQGSVASTLDLALAAAGERLSAGAAALGLALASSVAGRCDSAGATALGLNLALAAAGSDGSASRPRGPWVVERSPSGILTARPRPGRIVTSVQTTD